MCIIQSISSKKAEPFKLWLAQVGYERIEEIENPELAQDRVKQYYEMKGYPKDWIDKRLRGIAIRQDLTDEWKNRGIQEEKDFAILTNEISKATFGKKVEEYKKFKGLERKNQNLRDHMTDWELIFSMLGEKATTDITIARDAKGFPELKNTAKEGGNIAKNARIHFGEKIGTGFERIKEMCKKENSPFPDIEFNESYFYVVFKQKTDYLEVSKNNATPQISPQIPTKLEQKILTLIKQNPNMSRTDIAKMLNLSEDTIKEYIERLKQKNLLKRVGLDRGGHWEVTLREDNKKGKS